MKEVLQQAELTIFLQLGLYLKSTNKCFASTLHCIHVGFLN